MKKLSLIISVYNEEAVLEKFYKAFCSIEQNLEYGGGGYELIFVNDGSTDASMNILEVIAQQNKNVRVISFSRNFGHEAAMIAGIDHAAGDVIICMDADLQHPRNASPPSWRNLRKAMRLSAWSEPPTNRQVPSKTLHPEHSTG